ncbi:MAG: hypothetical protein GX657_01905 [Chloroflexi bacterium]|nr:hypothetical protein [Chloroflexota bacterium]
MWAKRLSPAIVAFVLLVAMALMPMASALLAQGPEGEVPLPQAEAEGPAISGDAAFAVDASALPDATDLGNGFYYQGILTESGVPVTGNRAMEFRLWDAAIGGAAVGGTLTPTVSVNRGQFTVVLTWPNAFTGKALWLGVRAKDSLGTWRDLGRRQILAVPYATSLMPGARVDGTGSGNSLTVTSSGSAYPLRAIATGASYDGVWGTGTNQGVYGDTTGSGAYDSGVFGGSWATSGAAKGGYFYSYRGIGVYGVSDTVEGVYGYAPNHDGVTGRSSVAGRSGVYGYSVNGYGVSARTDAGPAAVNAFSTATSGVHHGVLGATSSAGGAGVVGLHPDYSVADKTSFWMPAGLFAGTNGVIGLTKTSGGYGVIGWSQAASAGAGVYAYNQSAGGQALYAYNGNANGWAAQMYSADDGLYISVPAGRVGYQVVNGTKTAVVATDQGARALYSEESAEVWFTDYGFGQLVDGAATVPIDPLFAQTVNLAEPYHVFLQANGAAAIYLETTAKDHFTVRLLTGDPSVTFSYRLVALRLGFEGQRLGAAPWADSDPNLFPAAAGAGAGAAAMGPSVQQGVAP